MIRRLILAAALVCCTTFVGARAWIAQVPAGVAAFTTYDPANDLFNIVLSGGNLTVTAGTCAGGSPICAARGTSPTTHTGTDKVYYEVTRNTAGSFDDIGVQTSAYVPASANNIIGFDTTFGNASMAFSHGNSRFMQNNVALGTGAESGTCTGTIALAIDFGAAKAWVNCWTGATWAGWNAAETSPNPDSGTGGVTFTATGTWFVGFGTNISTTTSYTMNVGATAMIRDAHPNNTTTFSSWH